MSIKYFKYYYNLPTAHNETTGFLESRRSHKCVNVSIEHVAIRLWSCLWKWVSLTTRVWPFSEHIHVKSLPARHS